MTELLKKVFLVLTGIVLAKFGLESFLIPNHMIDGGVTGLSLLMSQLTSYPIWLFLVVFNVPFLVLSVFFMSVSFAVRGSVTILLFAVALKMLPHFACLTHDLFLAAIFGGLALGAGIACVIRGTTVIDGTEVLALVLGSKSHFSIGAIIFAFNAVLFLGAALVLDIELVMYAVITYFTASKTTNFFLYGIEEKIGVIIVSESHSTIRNRLTSDLGMGVTVFYGASGLRQIKKDVLMCITSAYEVPRLKNLVQEMDKDAFMVMYNVTNTVGGYLEESHSILV